jgi:hypothetical protein
VRLIDIAGIGVGFSGSVLLGLVLGFVLAKRDGNGLWIVAGLAGGMLLGGITMGPRLWSLMRVEPPNDGSLR